MLPKSVGLTRFYCTSNCFTHICKVTQLRNALYAVKMLFSKQFMTGSTFTLCLFLPHRWKIEHTTNSVHSSHCHTVRCDANSCTCRHSSTNSPVCFQEWILTSPRGHTCKQDVDQTIQLQMFILNTMYRNVYRNSYCSHTVQYMCVCTYVFTIHTYYVHCHTFLHTP